MTTESLSCEITYWKNMLSDIPVLDISTDFQRRVCSSYSRSKYKRSFDTNSITKLNNQCKENNNSRFVFLLSVLKILLSRYSAQEEICVGALLKKSSVNQIGKNRELAYGMTVFRTNVSGNLRFLDLLNTPKEGAIGSCLEANIELETLFKAQLSEKASDCTPLFQVMIIYNNYEISQIPSISISTDTLNEAKSQTDLTFIISDTGNNVELEIDYSRELFLGKTIERILTHYMKIFDEVMHDTKMQIADIDMLSDEEREKVVCEWNLTQQKFPSGCLHEMFERQVLRSPDSIALVSENSKVTYDELNAISNQIAHQLIESGVGPDRIVGVCQHRSLLLIASLLGVLKAGGAYVPIDPAYPKQRQNYMLEDSKASILLTERSLGKDFDKLPGNVKTIYVDEIKETAIYDNCGNPAAEAQPHNLAYVIYTSGSTGLPKGVAIEHRNVVALINWTRETYSYADLSGVLAATSICFDLSVFEIFGPLSLGGKVILMDSILHLPKSANSGEVTLINTVPSAVTELIRINGIPRSVQVVNLAGEALHRSLVDKIYELESVRDVYNLYGPSECTTYSTVAKIEKNKDTKPTIGRPISNTKVYILDSKLQPVPIGVIGEIFIGGEGVARGYFDKNKLTQEKFISCNLQGGERLYKTGDLARYTEDGNIVFLGRVDHQIKLRGFRIELGEIEAKILDYEGVYGAAVVVRKEVSGDRLAAYIDADSEKLSHAKILRQHLSNDLPGYMIPSFFVRLDELPLSPNGKIDRKKLPDVDIRAGIDNGWSIPLVEI